VIIVSKTIKELEIQECIDDLDGNFSKFIRLDDLRSLFLAKKRELEEELKIISKTSRSISETMFYQTKLLFLYEIWGEELK
jgi:hypothetical protein